MFSANSAHLTQSGTNQPAGTQSSEPIGSGASSSAASAPATVLPYASGAAAPEAGEDPLVHTPNDQTSKEIGQGNGGNGTQLDDHIETITVTASRGTNGNIRVADVTVNDFYNEVGIPGVGGAGHVGIGVNTDKTQGFYPKDESIGTKILEGLGVDVPGAVKKDDLSQPHASFTIHTTPAQDRAVQRYIDQTKAHPGSYNLYQKNCALFCEGGYSRWRPKSSNHYFPE